MDTSVQERTGAEVEVVKARLHYMADATQKPVNYAYDPPTGVPRSSGERVAQNVAIRDGRELIDALSLDTSGYR